MTRTAQYAPRQSQMPLDISAPPQDSHSVQSSEMAKPALSPAYKNLLIAMITYSLYVLGSSMLSDVYSQWMYVRFEQQILGKNFSANISKLATEDPCFRGQNNTSPFEKELNEAQTKASTFNIWRMLVSLGPAFFVNMLIGAYADGIGRKTLMLIPLAGVSVNAAVTCVVAYWHLNMYFLFLGWAVLGLTGNSPATFMALYVYIADNTTAHGDRSFGMVVAQAIMSMLFALSHLFMGYFISSVGYVWPMVSALTVLVVSLVICALFVKETIDTSQLKRRVILIQGLKTVFSFYLIPPADPRYRRKDFVLLGLVFFLFATCIAVSISTLYLMNEPFCWGSKKIGLVSSFQAILMSLASLVGVRILQRFVKDEVICVLSLLAGAASKFILSFSRYDWMVYTAFTVSALEISVLPVIRAILTRMVPSDKKGSLLSSIAVIEVATMLIAGSGLDGLYSATVSIWNGLTYFVIGCFILCSASMMIACAILFSRRQSAVFIYEVMEDDAVSPDYSSAVFAEDAHLQDGDNQAIVT